MAKKWPEMVVTLSFISIFHFRSDYNTYFKFSINYLTLIHYFPESEGECVNDYVTEIVPDYNVIESGNCGMKFECADGTCIDAEGENFLPIFLLSEVTTLISLINVGPTLTDFEKFHPPQNKNPPSTFIDFLDFSTLHSSFIRVMY